MTDQSPRSLVLTLLSNILTAADTTIKKTANSSTTLYVSCQHDGLYAKASEYITFRANIQEGDIPPTSIGPTIRELFNGFTDDQLENILLLFTFGSSHAKKHMMERALELFSSKPDIPIPLEILNTIREELSDYPTPETPNA